MLPNINTLLKPRPRKYRNLVKHIRRDLAFLDDEPFSLTQKELFNDLTSSRGTSRFMSIYSERGIEFILKNFGFHKQMKHTGLPKFTLKLDTSDSFKHRIQIIHQLGHKEFLSAELVMRRSTFASPPLDDKKYPPADLLVVEWFLLQNSLSDFSRLRPQLPGQEYPGLGVSKIIFEMFYWMAKRLKADGVVLVPNYLHTAIFYGKRFIFVDPIKQGILSELDLLRTVKYSTAQLSWACAEGQLIDKNNNSVFLWKPAPMILPVSNLAREYFGSPEYFKKVKFTQNLADLKINQGYKKHFDKNWTVNDQ